MATRLRAVRWRRNLIPSIRVPHSAPNRLLRQPAGFAALATLLCAVGLSSANGFIGGMVAYERDTTVFYYPLLAWAGQQLRAVSFPLWCPQILAGYPLFADGELGLASPTVLLSLLTLPPDVAFVVLRLVHLSIAALGAYALARAWRLPHAAATMAGVTFGLGSFLQAHIQHENIVRTAAWLPLTLACVERALRAAGRGRRRWILGAGASVGLAGLGLHPEILLVNLITLGGYGLLRWPLGPIGSGARSGLSRALGIGTVVASSVALGLALAAVQLVPLAELAPLSARSGSFPYSEVAGQSFSPPGIVQLVFPYFFRAADNLQWGLWTHWESYLYVGLAPLVLVIVALTRVRRTGIAIWALLGTGGLIIAIGQYSPVDAFWLLWKVPGFGWLRAPGRFELLVVLTLAMLAAHGMAILQARARLPAPGLASVWRWSIVWAVLLPGVIAVVLEGVHWALIAAPDASLRFIETHYLSLPRDKQPLSADDVYHGLRWATDLSNVRAAGALLGLLCIGAAIAAWQTAPWPRIRRWRGWPAVLVLAAAADLLAFGWAIHPREALSTLASPDPAVAAVRQLLREQNASDGPARVFGSPIVDQVAPDRLASLGLQDAGGYSSLDTSRQRAFLLRVQRVDDDLLDLWNVRYILDPPSYGALSSYAGVNYFARNPLLDAPARNDLGDEVFRIPPGFEPAEIRVVSALVGGSEVPQGTGVAQITLRSLSGEALAQRQLRAGIETMDWGWDDLVTTGDVRHGRVEVAGEVADKLADGEVARRILSFARTPLARPVQASTIQIQSLAAQGALVVYGVALVDRAGQVHQLFGRQKTKYRQVLRDQNVSVLENTAAYPRAFLVSRARLAPAGGSLEQMVRQPFTPSQEVILGAETPSASLNPSTLRAPGRASLAPPGTARIERYTPVEMALQVETPAPTFLVVSDAFYPGWHAYLDGDERPILRGDLIFRVVEVPAGSHRVVFRFEPTTVSVGLAISFGAVALFLGALVAELRTFGVARRRATAASS